MSFPELRLVVGAVALIVVQAACSPAPPSPPDATPLAAGRGDARPTLAVCFDRATAAIEAGDWEGARAALREGIELEPDVPALRLHAARAEAALGHEAACLVQLEHLAALGATADLASDEIFAGLAGRPSFDELARRLTAAGAPPPPAEIVHRFDDAELWPEGIALDPDTGDLYVGSMHRRTIYRITPAGEVAELGSSSSDGLMEVLGLWVDAPRRALWAVTGEGAFREPLDGPPRTNELVRYDLVTGRLDRRYPAPDDELRLLNDVTVGPDGTAWITESLRGELYRVAPGAGLELAASFPDLAFLNGIAMSDDGQRLYLGHYAGISVLSPADLSIRRVTGEKMALGMVDGMSWTGRGLVLVQNSRYVSFRLARVELGPSGDRALSLEVLPAGLPEGLIPYTCAVGDGSVFVIAAAPFELMDGDTAPPAPVVVRVALAP